MKKILSIIFIITSLFILRNKNVYASYENDTSSIGAFLPIGMPIMLGGGITGKFDKVPLVFAISGGGSLVPYFGYGLYITADWWGLNKKLGLLGTADTYFRLGAGFDISMPIGANFVMDFGVRMPMGFSFVVKKNWEIFLDLPIGISLIGFGVLEGATVVRVFGNGIESVREDNFFEYFYVWLRINPQIGFRYWF